MWPHRRSPLLLLVTTLATVACKSPDEKLIAAIEAGDESAARGALDKEANPNAMDRDGNPALIAAIAAGHPAVAMALLEAGARADVRDSMQRSALLLAFRAGQKEVVTRLMGAGASADIRDANGSSLLHLASAAGDDALVGALVAKRVELDARDQEGKTALQVAVEKGHVPIAERLLDAGARADATDQQGRSAATAAMTSSNPELAGLFRADAKSRLSFADGAIHELTAAEEYEGARSSVRMLDGKERYQYDWQAPWDWRKAIAMGAVSLAHGRRVAVEKLHMNDWPTGLSAERSLKDDDIVATAVEQLTGRRWVTERQKVGESFLNHYDGQTLSVLFNRYYSTPDEHILGIRAASLYHTFLEDLARRTVRATLALLKPEPKMAEMAKSYLTAVKKGTDGTTAVNDILAANYDLENLTMEAIAFEGALAADLEPEPLQDEWAVAILGTLLRRQLDGTLEVIARCALRMLDDYDPASARALREGLEGNGIL